jgi:hypothetical protein
MEIHIDRKVLPQMNTMYKFAEQIIKENADVPENAIGKPSKKLNRLCI